ncbi:MAG: mitochondrial fission ELM1 family protein [Rickettsiales bacterium]
MTRVIWALIDDRPGTATQVLGIAEHLADMGHALFVKRLHYSALSVLPNFMKGCAFLGIDRAKSDALEVPWPDMVIAAGRRAAPVALWIKRKNPLCFAVQIMHPDMNLKPFDAVILPRHDHPPELPNVIPTLGAPHRWLEKKLDRAVADAKEKLALLPRPYTAVLIGGNTKYGELMDDDIRILCQSLANNISEGSLLVTTSRRTPKKLVTLLKERLPEPYWLHTADDTGENPYPAFLGAADQIIVTADSISMLSEACVRGVPVYNFSPAYTMSRKHRRAVAMFEREGLVRPLTHFSPEWKGGRKLDESSRLARFIAERLA